MMKTFYILSIVVLVSFSSCGYDDFIFSDDDSSPPPFKLTLSTLTTLPISTGGLDVDQQGSIYAADFGVGLANILMGPIFLK